MPNSFLDQAEAALGQLALSVFRGGALAAIDRVFNLTVSARAQAAPQVTGAMRSVPAQARLAASHHVSFDPEAFIADAATLYALVQALRSAPDDSALFGLLPCDYTPVEDFEFWALGAALSVTAFR